MKEDNETVQVTNKKGWAEAQERAGGWAEDSHPAHHGARSHSRPYLDVFIVYYPHSNFVSQSWAGIVDSHFLMGKLRSRVAEPLCGRVWVKYNDLEPSTWCVSCPWSHAGKGQLWWGVCGVIL